MTGAEAILVVEILRILRRGLEWLAEMREAKETEGAEALAAELKKWPGALEAFLALGPSDKTPGG